MTRMTRPNCAVSLIPPREDQCEWHRMTRMTGPDCVVMCNLINTHTHTGPDYAVMCNDIYMYIYSIHKPRARAHTHTVNKKCWFGSC